ncbi:MAG: YicC family protein [Alicyclobacillus mali]|uniref:YicC/YloC family endoribonuclease n=1 Tax=Alicyclobacillus mali (ex Roth et al. 2021) TaxID=1123961 RepID=UPI000829BD8C|nr:YicC/YloC family endoribonuclease [Alicyclobacillus mali (ex Roth et al. 2021)]MCL6488548.1 YicC family protein [Alicyclobacillus mali (ex Roth et al. 2021)]
MGIRSMTGFGRAEGRVGPYDVVVEAKSVNHRFLEVSVRLPRDWSFAEVAVRDRVRGQLQRGRVDIAVSLAGTGAAAGQVYVDWALVDALVEADQTLCHKLGVPFDPRSARQWLTFPGAVSVRPAALSEEEAVSSLGDLVNAAIDKLVAMREREGGDLARACVGYLDDVEAHLRAIRQRAPASVAAYRASLLARVSELGISVDDARLAQEVALFADRVAIDEELVRLEAHVQAMRSDLERAEPVGRRLDFLVQEMHREVNTIASKSQDAEISRHVVEMKALIEKLREQAQNVE